MFESLQQRLGDVFTKLKRKGALSEEDVGQALREIRIALLEADVALPVVKDFVERVKKEAIGQEILRSVTPGQMVIKIVHDQLIHMLGGEEKIPPAGVDLAAPAPVGVLMVGLQGSGKTTSTAKTAKRLHERERKKVLMASLDVYRPAAQEQLAILGTQIGVDTLSIVPGESPLAISRRAMQTGALQGFDVVMLDTAGRLSIDEALMTEIQEIKKKIKPHETLLVADAMTGQDAVNTAARFHEAVGLDGIVLTRIDGDARGGAALSMRAVTGCPIRLVGTGEKLDQMEVFHADRMAGRILDMGDVVSLVEKAAESIEEEEAEKLAKKMQKGKFDLNDMAGQIQQMKKMGGLSQMIGMLPGAQQLKDKMKSAQLDESVLNRQLAIISSMTKQERKRPEVIKASRRLRIAKGSGTTVQDVNKLLKQHMETQKMMKRMQSMGKKGMMRGGMNSLLPPGMGKGGF